MSKHYNLTVTDDNGKSVTTSNTSTEHAEEILRMMQLAGMQDSSCGCGESIEENEYQPTPANDKLDLDDYSKKSGESIPKQKKSLDKAPSRGDNPLEYSLDENEIFESLMNEFEEVKEAKVGTPGSLEKVEAQIKKLKDMAQKAKDAGDPQKANTIQSSDEMTELLRKQRKLKNESVEEGKLNPGLQAYIDKKKGKKDDKEDKVEEKKAKPDFVDIDGDGDKKETMKKAAKDKKEKTNEVGSPTTDKYYPKKQRRLPGVDKPDPMVLVPPLDPDELPQRVSTPKASPKPPVPMDMMDPELQKLYKNKKMAPPIPARHRQKIQMDSIEEGFEADEVKAILAKHGVSSIDDMELDGELYQDLFDYYSDEMPYGTQKARDGDPMDWIITRLDDLGMVESTSEQKNSEEVEDTGLESELDRLRKLANIKKASSEEVEQVDEILPAVLPVAKAVGGALLKKGIKGTVARAGAGMAAKKAMGSNNQA